jgi:Nuclease-related domain
MGDSYHAQQAVSVDLSRLRGFQLLRTAGRRVCLGVEETSMTEVTVNRWRRWGHDVLYVNDVDGSRIGYHNRLSGETVIERPDLADLFESAIADYAPKLPSAPTACTAVVVPSLSDASTEAWVDLSSNKPGQGARKQAKAWAAGADGEEIIGAYVAPLETLGWRILHAITVGSKGADIDHLAIGPGGVFTLDTKTHLGVPAWAYQYTVYVNGQEKSRYLPKSRGEAALATRRLSEACGFSVDASAVIVILCDGLSIKQQPAGVHVVGGSAVADWLHNRPAVLTAIEVEAIWEHARRSTTWLPVG